uniref:Uncharacterized protein n=1 Tax=Nelumbo nucifera TaxID=4432 RepID=A0A822Z169_NELNU|nr:TPA_asm: hypothetical protein HUJ06_014467 [Nelumbo nucifera]
MVKIVELSYLKSLFQGEWLVVVVVGGSSGGGGGGAELTPKITLSCRQLMGVKTDFLFTTQWSFWVFIGILAGGAGGSGVGVGADSWSLGGRRWRYEF